MHTEISAWLRGALAGAMLMGTAAAAVAQSASSEATREEQRKADALRSDRVMEDGTMHTFDRRYKGMKGTPYLTASWQKADLKLSNKLLKSVPIRYDVLHNTLMVMQSPGDSLVVAPGQVSEFAVVDALQPGGYRTFRRFAFLNNNKVTDAYFEVLAEAPQLTLIKLHKKEVQRFNRDKTSSLFAAQSGFDEIQDSQEYFVYGANNRAVAVRLNRKSLEKALAEVSPASSRPASLAAETATVRTEQDLVTLFQALSRP